LVVTAAIAGVMLTLAVIVATARAQAPSFTPSAKTAPRFAKTDDIITYTIVVVNAGGPITDVALSDPIPNGSAFIVGSCTYHRIVGGPQPCDSPPDLWREDFAASERITTTFAVRVTAGSMNWSLVNYAYINWGPSQTVVLSTTTTVNPLECFLPLVVRRFPPRPDLRIASLAVQPSSPAVGQTVIITIVVENVGRAAAGPFWVDLYDNPDPPPTRANQPFNSLCRSAQDCYGIAWYVDDDLEPEQSVVLNSVIGYAKEYSRWPGYFVGTGIHDVYAFADSWNAPVWYGAVLEQNEGLDNRYGPVSVNVTPAVSGWSPGAVEQDLPLPRRPNRP
jgi:uncharacterized repeat protein (TIGR01451 family)